MSISIAACLSSALFVAPCPPGEAEAEAEGEVRLFEPGLTIIEITPPEIDAPRTGIVIETPRGALSCGPRLMLLAPTPEESAAYHAYVHADHWQEAAEAKAAFAAMGDGAFTLLYHGVRLESDVIARQRCFDLILESFADHAGAGEVIGQLGLNDDEPRIRYDCAFQCGPSGFAFAEARLREIMTDPAETERMRLTAAKSLAELGHVDVVRTLWDALASDWYMDRYLANLGFIALVGRGVNGGDYDWHEGAFVSGGVEAVREFDAIALAEQRAARYTAIAHFARWMAGAQPHVYGVLVPNAALFDLNRLNGFRPSVTAPEP